MLDNDFSTWSDDKIIHALRQGNSEVRNYVYLRYISTAVKFWKNRNRMEYYSISDGDVYDILWEKLATIDSQTGQDRYSTFQPGTEGNEFEKWIFKQVRNAISSLAAHQRTKRATFDRNASNAPPVEELASKFENEYREYTDKRAFLQECFTELWCRSPMKAYVLLLRTQFSFTYKEVDSATADRKNFLVRKISHEETAKILNTSEENARQLFIRSIAQFKEIMKEKRKSEELLEDFDEWFVTFS